MIKRSIQEKDIPIVNTYALNIGALQNIYIYIYKIDSDTAIVGDFNTSLISMDRSPGQKISKDTQALK